MRDRHTGRTTQRTEWTKFLSGKKRGGVIGVGVKLMFIHVRVVKAVNLIWCIFFL